MATTIYKSSDTSAPVLDGQVGSLVNLLDKCLVAGYGSQAAAGWTKPFSGTNTAVYLGTAGHYLDVNDNGAGAAGAQEATVRGYEAMTAVATGTNPFPTTAQAASPGLYIRKSTTASATARGWVVVADGTTFHLFILSADTAGRYQSFSFGRFYSFKTSDTYRSAIVGHTATGGSSTTGLDIGVSSGATSSTIAGAFWPRVQAGTGTSANGGIMGVGSTALSSPFNGPNLADGNVYLSRLFVTDATTAGGLRGYLRGVYQILTGVNLNDGDTFTGATGTDFAGRTFLVLNRCVGGAYYALETSAWDSSS